MQIFHGFLTLSIHMKLKIRVVTFSMPCYVSINGLNKNYFFKSTALHNSLMIVIGRGSSN